MAKKINVNNLEKATKKQYTTKQCKTMINGEEMIFSYDTVFKDSKIKETILEWIALKEATLEIEEFNMVDIFIVLQIKYFTDIEFAKYDNPLMQLSHYAKMGNYLADLKTEDNVSMLEIVTKCFPETELVKISKQMETVGGLLIQELENQGVVNENN